tara:strand:- start:6830 stop:7051 length:222 start_codon:yes stop_codon:yes gene_type:complete
VIKMSENNEVVNINGKEYNSDDLSDLQKYLIAQIQECQARVNRASMDVDRERAALDSFTSRLIADIEAQKKAS